MYTNCTRRIAVRLIRQIAHDTPQKIAFKIVQKSWLKAWLLMMMMMMMMMSKINPSAVLSDLGLGPSGDGSGPNFK